MFLWWLCSWSKPLHLYISHIHLLKGRCKIDLFTRWISKGNKKTSFTEQALTACRVVLLNNSDNYKSIKHYWCVTFIWYVTFGTWHNGKGNSRQRNLEPPVQSGLSVGLLKPDLPVCFCVSCSITCASGLRRFKHFYLCAGWHVCFAEDIKQLAVVITHTLASAFVSGLSGERAASPHTDWVLTTLFW